VAKSWSTTALPLLRIIRCSRRLPMCLTTGGAPAIIAARWSWMKPAPATAAGRPRPLHRRFAPTSAQRTLASAGRRSCTTASSGPSTGSAAKIMYRSKKIDDSGQVIGGSWRNDHRLQEGGQVYNLSHLSSHHGQTGASTTLLSAR